MMKNKILAVIPARGGSKGLCGKNVKEFCGKPLICWTIDAVRGVLEDEDICVSTDYFSIAEIVRSYGLEVPFLRPDYLASDFSTTRDVLLHALNYYKSQGKNYEIVLLLQPTSPLRTTTHITEALALYNQNIDMVVSVKRSHTATVIANDNQCGYLELTLNNNGGRRQNMPEYYEYNGAIYVINANSLYCHQNLNFERKIKYIMDEKSSIDIDNQLDFDIAEMIKMKEQM